MGFMDISVVGSDTASDLLWSCGDTLAPLLRRELRVKNSGWNTDGWCNVALFFDEVIIPSGHFRNHEELVVVARLSLKKLEAWLKNPVRNEKLDKDYKRLRKSLTRYIKESPR